MLRRGVITCKGDRCRPGTVADAVENIRDGRCGVGFGSSVSVDSLVHKAIDCVQCLSFPKVTQFSNKLAFSVSEFSENLKTDILEKQSLNDPKKNSGDSETQKFDEMNVVNQQYKSTKAKNPKNELNVFSLLIAIIKGWFSRTKQQFNFVLK